MRNILSIAFIASLLFTGCGNKWLEEAQPSTSTESSEAIKSAREAQYALNGAYDFLRNYEYYGARMTYYGDVTGEDLQANGDTKRAAKFYLFDYNKDTAPSSLWRFPYRVLRNVNGILAFANGLPAEGLSEELKDIKGQALALRALAHFDLVKVFGAPFSKDNGASLGVPIEVEKHNSSSKPSRNTVKQVYDQVIIDLEDASKLLSTARNNGKINRFAAQQLLARAYLYMGQNQKAFDTATQMITEAQKSASSTKGQYFLWTNEEYSTVWSKDFTSEILFQLPIIKTETGSDTGGPGKDGIGYLLWRLGYNDIILSGDYMNLLKADPNDVRHKIITKYTSKQVDYYYLNKYPGNPAEGETPQEADIPVLRLSEAYLIAAEAAVKIGDNTNALKYLNAIVTRANPAKSVSGTVTLERVMEERRKELVGEGHRLFDATRNNMRIERKAPSHNSPLLRAETKSFDRTYFKTVMAIPRGEIDANTNIIQNDGY
ncbi:RagB/SusD family nutrient uptake outer membrane protein [Sphingobacterium yanglingense]|uniref:SusD-like starch-binding protein associating with outer membrane n=1 Tax=Sphingobacterium yanglingense TaxID=1437280 RepID=A0A4R6W7Z3_9SPHI|nr:RagB/SusD family nutrient uptake outer membrane protein [Sphingobacterium yanglingense]TDQ73531.1 SusD-like starch-binding protein associating with outer membrane [Sphingobacterium yanglingense]